MVLNFDVRLFCENLRATKPPYECPVKGCNKVYRSHVGIQFHLYNYAHDSADTSTGQSPKSKGRRGPWHHRRLKRSLSPPEFTRSYSRDPVLVNNSNQVVEVEMSNGRTLKVDVHEPLKIVVEDNTDVEKEHVGKMSPTAAKETGSRKDGSSSTYVHLSPNVKLPEPCFKELDDYVKPNYVPPRSTNYYRFVPKTAKQLEEEVEYDMDDMDAHWLNEINERRTKSNIPPVSKEIFEKLMDGFEKESYFYGQSGTGPVLSDDDAICCICLEGDCQINNAILFCDLCNLAVHQECYGVPHIPDGPWACRRCLYSPSHAVECCLCPSKRGAFKQTDDGRWAHVVCALWIPEVSFANSVFLEPIDSIDRIAPARWKLTCCVCKRRGIGACIQCHKTSCYTAFHVTCAQQAGLYMKVEPVKECTVAPGNAGAPLPPLRKMAYCNLHSPKDPGSSSAGSNSDEEGAYVRQEDREYQAQLKEKVRKARKVLAETNTMGPVISVPVISPSSIAKMSSKVSFQQKDAFIDKLHAYWQLKRDSLDGVPLRRSAPVSSSQINRSEGAKTVTPRRRAVAGQKEALTFTAEDVTYCRRLRREMEKVRLLLELVKKREKMKMEEVKVFESLTELRLRPLSVLLRRALDLIEPPKENGHLSGMRQKLHRYASVDEFVDEFQMIIAGLLEASLHHTAVHRTVVRMKDQATGVFRSLRRVADKIGFEMETGLHLEVSADQTDQQTVCSESADSAVPSSSSSMQSDIKEAPVETTVPPAAVPTGVNRRTMILFSKKAKQRRLSLIQMAAEKVSLDKGTLKEEILPAQDTVPNVIPVNNVTLKVASATDENTASSDRLVQMVRPPAKRRRSVSCEFSESSNHNDTASVKGTTKVPDPAGDLDKTVDSRTKRGSHMTANGVGVNLSDSLKEIANMSRYPIRNAYASGTQKRKTVAFDANLTNRKSPASISNELHPPTFKPLDCVWAKCRGFPWYPGMIINPKMPRAGITCNGLHIPGPPDAVLNNKMAEQDTYLVLFFDIKQTWQWLPPSALESLGVDQENDDNRCSSAKKPAMHRSIQQAYSRAIAHFHYIASDTKRHASNNGHV